ncbi:oligoendopeptidase F [Bacillus sp. FSL W7-1360]
MNLTQRTNVPLEQTWDLSDLFKDDHKWEQALQSLAQDVHQLSINQGTLDQGAETLLSVLQTAETILEKYVLVSHYSSLRLSEDGTNEQAQANETRTDHVGASLKSQLAKIEADISALPNKKINEFRKQEPGLARFDVYLDQLLRDKPYVLSSETEEILAALSPVLSAPYSTYSVSKAADMAFPTFTGADGLEKPLSFARFEDHYEESSNTGERRRAYDAFDQTLQQYEHTYAQLYATEVQKQVVLARSRGYESATAMLLHEQDVTMAMYTNQLDIIYHELAPIMQRFARLKKEVLNLDELYFCDLKAPLDPEFQPETTYEEAFDAVMKALTPLGTAYQEMLVTARDERWVDRADNIGKSTGAFCASPYGSHPYILLTWTNSMRGAFTLAHELGHAGHFHLANQHQPLNATECSMYVVEAPSTMNELFLGNYLLKQSDDSRMKRWVILEFLGTYYHNFVTHLLEGAFQRRIYAHAEAGTPLTAALLRQEKQAVLQGFWGDTVTVDERAGRTWMRQPHYYMGLYPYTYSAGLTAATKAYKLYEEQGQPIMDAWLSLLKTGGKKSPLDLLNIVGINMEDPQTIRDAISYVDTLVTELEASYA